MPFLRSFADVFCRVTPTYMLSYKEDLCRFDSNVDRGDEYICEFIEDSFTGKRTSAIDGVVTPLESGTEAPHVRSSYISL